jgi:flagellar hook protein FlgE
MFASIAGLRNHQMRLDVIGANIANVNTPGFKKSRVTFQDSLYQQLRGAKAPEGDSGGTNSLQIGLGMQVGTIEVNHSGGSPQMTGKISDLCIQGEGFFITKPSDDRQFYTRTGTFDFDVAGNFYNVGNGQKVQGYMADTITGKINTSADLQGINISGHRIIPPKATENINLVGNINLTYGFEQLPKLLTKTIYDSLGAEHELKFCFDKDNVNLSGNLDPASSPVTTTIAVKDSAGNEASFDAEFTYNPVTNKWEVSTTPQGGETVIDFPTELEANNLGRYEIQVSGGSLTKTVKATIDLTALTQQSTGTSSLTASTHKGPGVWNVGVFFDGVAPAAPATSQDILFDGNGNVKSIPNSYTIQATNLPLGAEDLNILVDFNKMTQYNADWTAWPENQDGYAAGTLRSFSIDSSGTIVGSYSNGRTNNIAQVAIATFQNPSGVMPLGESMYVETVNSGNAKIGAPGEEARGTIIPGALEMSNVDLSEEFTDMITTQRGFQANSRIITTSDEMLQELVNLKR